MSTISNNINGIITSDEDPFSMVSNSALRDNTLSLKGKGLYAMIKSYITIPNFILYKTTLKKVCVEGETAFESTWKELKDSGYLIQYRNQSDNGHYFYSYKLLSTKNIELANEIHSKQNRKQQVKKTHTPKTEGMDKNEENHTPKTKGMDTKGNGKRGVYNNTNLNNTYLNNTITSISTTQSSACSTENTENIIEKETCACSKPNNPNKDLIEQQTHLTLTPNQSKKVSKWDIKKTDIAIKLFKRENGEYFTLLDKIYCDSRNFAPNMAKKGKFNNFSQREYDMEDLERKLLGWD